jgi:hypothetical protein
MAIHFAMAIAAIPAQREKLKDLPSLQEFVHGKRGPHNTQRPAESVTDDGDAEGR